jgi:hypothetical protein
MVTLWAQSLPHVLKFLPRGDLVLKKKAILKISPLHRGVI